jgi:uncharacterized membrane protein HdeD (DUF308 family)
MGTLDQVAATLQTAIAASPDVVNHWGLFLAFGILLLLLGLLAVWRSLAATVASMVFFGSILLIASIIEIVQAIMVGSWSYFFPHLLSAILFGVAGLFLLRKPVAGAEVVTVFMAFFFLVGGLFEIISVLSSMPPGWGWDVLSGVVSIVLGLLILANWPVAGLHIIGLYVGISLIFAGWAWSAIALGLRRMAGTV